MLISALVAMIVTLLAAARVLAPVELPIRDLLLRTLPERPPTQTVVLAIDDASLTAIGPWPWPRARLADLVSQAADRGATAFGIDLLLNEPRSGDAVLAKACGRIECVGAATLDDKGTWILPNEALRSLQPAHAAFELDHDGLLRRISSTKQDARLSFPAFSVALAALHSGMPVSGGEVLMPDFRTAPRAIPVVSAAAVLQKDPRALALLRGRIAVAGITAVALGDRVRTPQSGSERMDAGVAVHAAAIESLLAGGILRDASPLASGLFGGVLTWLGLSLRRVPALAPRLAIQLALLALPVIAFLVLARGQTLLPVVLLTITVGAALLAVEAHRAIGVSRQGRAAALTLERDLGTAAGPADVGQRLESLASEIVQRHARELESKRMLVHELKTPLSAMDNLSQLLVEFDLTSEERRRVASLLGDETRKLQSMITGLMEIERLALRPREGVRPVIDLGTMAKTRVAFLAGGLAREIHVSSDGTPLIAGDTSLLERILDNLIGNAARYSPTDSAIDVSVRRENSHVLLAVLDRGPGIPEAERDEIFRTFRRGSAAAGTEGLGLGLTIVSEAARWHGATVEVAARERGGTVFTVRFPALEAMTAEAV